MSETLAASLRAADLRCEYLVDPVGIDVLEPRLSWKLVATDPAAHNLLQSKYRVLVASSAALLDNEKGDLWDSGVIESDRSVHVVYAGAPLKSRQRCYWTVQVWDQAGRPSGWSRPAFWSLGLLGSIEWGAEWIGLDETGGLARENQDQHTRLPARMLRREINLNGKVRHATAYMSGLGFSELYLNGEKVGDRLMNPGLTEYRKRVFYTTLNVTGFLKAGANAVGAILGNGRFFAPRKSVPVATESYGYPKLLFHLDIEYEDGGRERLVSDGSWQLTDRGPIRANNEYDGEEYDARMEQAGWALPGFSGNDWRPAQIVEAPAGKLCAQMIEPIRITETLTPKTITNPEPGTFLIDFGQSIYGVPEIRVCGPRGTRVEIRTSFNVNEKGLLKTENDRSAQNTDVYTLKGEGLERWHPRFKGNAFRYIQVQGFPGAPDLDSFRGHAVHTDMEPVGAFESSNNLINRIYLNGRWGTRLQNRSIPMEPDRDERQGWSGHPAKTSESEAYQFHVAPFYQSWLDSIRADQHADGALQEISPGYWTFGSKGTIWPAVITIIPEWFHAFYADTRILDDNYPAMKRWVDYHIETNQKDDYTIDHVSYGDWVDASTMDREGTPWGATSKLLISNSYHYNNVRLLARVAELLGLEDDHKRYSDLAAKIRDGVNSRFFDPATLTYESDTQCACALPLAFGLVPDEHRRAVADRLVELIMDENGGHLSVGLVCMGWFMQVLTDIGRPDVAYTVATRTERPGWGYMISKGATTIWERWDTDTQGPGMNGESQKILSGNLEAWFYQTLGGINYDRKQPGFKHIILSPKPVGDLQWVKASHECLYGQILSDWRIRDGVFIWNIGIPHNTTAAIKLPQGTSSATIVPDQRIDSGEPFHLGSGQYQIRADYERQE